MLKEKVIDQALYIIEQSLSGMDFSTVSNFWRNHVVMNSNDLQKVRDALIIAKQKLLEQDREDNFNGSN